MSKKLEAQKFHEARKWFFFFVVYCVLLSCHIIEIMFMALKPQHHLAFNQPQKQFIALYTLPPWPLSLKSLLLHNIRGNKWLLWLVKCGTEAKVCFIACIIQTNIDYSCYTSPDIKEKKWLSPLSKSPPCGRLSSIGSCLVPKPQLLWELVLWFQLSWPACDGSHPC